MVKYIKNLTELYKANVDVFSIANEPVDCMHCTQKIRKTWSSTLKTTLSIM